jgi:sortilin
MALTNTDCSKEKKRKKPSSSSSSSAAYRTQNETSFSSTSSLASVMMRKISYAVLLLASAMMMGNLIVRADDESNDLKCPENNEREYQSLTAITQPSPIEQFEWVVKRGDAVSDETFGRVILKLQNGQIEISKDNGKTYSDYTTLLSGFSDKEYVVDVILTQVQSDSSVKNAILQGNKDRHWATKDVGDSWIQPCGFQMANENGKCFKSPYAMSGGTYDDGWRIVGTMVMHPGKHREDFVLAMVSRPECRRAHYDDSVVCANDLMVSQDFGQTWQNLTAKTNDIVSFVDFDWGPDPDPTHTGTPSILATVYTSTDDLWKSRKHEGFSFAVSFVRSATFFEGKDWFAHKTPCGNVFEVLNNDVYVAALKDCDKYLKLLEKSKTDIDDSELRYDEVLLEVSTNNGETFDPICFPENIRAKAFSIFDFDSEAAGPDFISIDHAEEAIIEGNAPMGNLYAADDSLKLFSLSLRHNVRQSGIADFAGIASMDGVLIANQISHEAFSASSRTPKYTNYFQTLQSFNGGGVWRYIPAPKTDANGNPIQGCAMTEDPRTVCSLHLHGDSSWIGGSDWSTRFGAVYSHKSTPGVIISTGNIGNVLSYEPSEVNTYISRDGGLTWEETLRGAHIYEFGNFGALIVAARESSSGQTNEVWFSRDVGACWEGPIKLSKPINVHNIRTDVVQKGTVFVIHGEDASKEEYEASGIAYVLDFNNLLLSNSTFKINQCDEQNDYETWFLNIPNQKECNMGVKLERRRRKRLARCLNLETGVVSESKDLVASTKCECERLYDTSCEYGYYRVHASPSVLSSCDPMENVNIMECQYLVEKGAIPKTHERIVHGDTCTNPLNALGTDYENIGNKKNKKKTTKHPVFGFFLFCLFSVAFFMVYKYFELGRFVPHGFKNTVNEFIESVQDWFRRMRSKSGSSNRGFSFGRNGGGGSRPDGYFEPLADFDEDEI